MARRGDVSRNPNVETGGRRSDAPRTPDVPAAPSVPDSPERTAPPSAPAERRAPAESGRSRGAAPAPRPAGVFSDERPETSRPSGEDTSAERRADEPRHDEPETLRTSAPSAPAGGGQPAGTEEPERRPEQEGQRPPAAGQASEERADDEAAFRTLEQAAPATVPRTEREAASRRTQEPQDTGRPSGEEDDGRRARAQTGGAGSEEIDIDQPLLPAPPGQGLFEDDVPPVPRFDPRQLPTERFPGAKARQQLSARQRVGGRLIGSAIESEVQSDPAIHIHEVGLPAPMVWRAYLDETSVLRDMLDSSPDIDPARMVDESYAIPAIIDYFANNDVEAVVEKRPVVDEASVHKRIARVHNKPGIRINPMVFAMWNADFDGDRMRVSFDPVPVSGAKKALDFLVGTEGKGKIDPDFFDMAVWGDGVESVSSILRKMFVTETDSPINITDGEINALAEAITKSWSSDADAGYRSMMRWARRIGHRQGRAADDVTARIIEDIHAMNREIRIAAKIYEGLPAFLDIPVAERPSEEALAEGPGPVDLTSPPGKVANLYDLWEMEGAVFGTVERRNPQFRRFSDVAKAVRNRPDLFAGGQEVSGPRTIEEVVAYQASGVSRLDGSTYAVSKEARRLVLESVGFPDVSSPEAFRTWCNRFLWRYNRVAYAFNSAAAKVNLDGSIVPYDDLSLPSIPTDDQVRLRKAFRTQFYQTYNGYTMSRIFGKAAPPGWEDVTLDEFVRKNGWKDTGTVDTPFDSPENLIKRLADLRTSFARDFRNMLLTKDKRGRVTGGALQELMRGDKTLFRDVYGRLTRGEADAQDIAYVAEAIYLISPEMFDFFGLDNPAAFREKGIGRKLAMSKSAEELGGVLYEMIVAYRIAPVLRYERLAAAAKTGEEQDMYVKRLEHELGSLASSSTTWKHLVDAYRSGSDVFEKVVFADLAMTKKDILLDKLVKTGPAPAPSHQPYEVAADLFALPQGPYSGERFSSDLGHSDIRRRIRSSVKMVRRFEEQSWKHWSESVSAARKRHEKRGGLTAFLSAVADDPSLLVALEPWMIAEAATSGTEKTYASSEKSSQEQPSNYIYSAVSNLVNGSVHSDLEMGGDIALGRMALDRFQERPAYLARLLTDPSFAITVYDGTGSIRLDRETLLGPDPDESDLWDWLEAHPRAAMALREHAMANSVGKGGFSPKTATRSLSDTITNVLNAKRDRRYRQSRVMKALADHPGFYAMVALSSVRAGAKRSQTRGTATKNVYRVIDLIRSIADNDVDTAEYVRQIARASGLDVERIERIHQAGLEQAIRGGDLVTDVTDTYEYQMGELLVRLSTDLETYAQMIPELGLAAHVDPIPPEQAASLFDLSDKGAYRTYFDTVQTISAAKTEISTSVNGAESQRNASLMILAQYMAPRCDAPLPEGIPVLEFAADWQGYEGRKVFIPAPDDTGGRWIPVDETTIDIIARAVGDTGVVYVEDPAVCSDPLCPCVRHATVDPSTNYGKQQTLALGRFLTIVRTLSSEGLNLKVKTVGDDGTDSIVKNRLSDFIDSGIDASFERAYADSVAAGEDGLAAARVALARTLKDSFERMGYKDELTESDYINVAHILVRPIVTDDGSPSIRILSVGELNSIVLAAVARARDMAGPEGLSMDEAISAAVRSLTLDAYGDLDVETVLSGIKAVTEMPARDLRSGLISKYQSSIGRNIDLIEEILSDPANENVKPHSEKELDAYEDALRKEFPRVFSTWADIAGKRSRFGTGGDRYSYRILGVISPSGRRSAPAAVGFRNAWVIDARSKETATIASAIDRAYELGLTVFIDGDLPQAVWDSVQHIDQMQLVPLDGDAHRYMLPMFDIRLNGGNTVLLEGAVNAGVFHSLPENVRFIIESPINEFDLGDAEAQATQSYVEEVHPFITDDYVLPLRIAFANLLSHIEESGSTPGAMYASVAKPTREQLLSEIVDPFVAEVDPDAPAEFDKKWMIDTGTIVEEGSAEDMRLRTGILRYLSRWHETDENGFLPDGKPDEIIGWMRAEYDGEYRYHPIRVFEADNKAGAPASFEIDDVVFDRDRQELVVSWRHEGTMLGRMFKVFTYDAASNKFMVRSEAVPDITFRNGVKASLVIASQSTASRNVLTRRKHNMSTVMYMARIDPYGYNLAELPETFPANPEIKEALLGNTASIGAWSEWLAAGDVLFFPSSEVELNAICNDMARKAVRYGVNPTAVFASRHNGVPSNVWFNFEMLFEGGPYYQDSFMRLFHSMMPTLVPDGIYDDSGNTLFNTRLQLFVDVDYVKRDGGRITGGYWADVDAGFHFLDEHFTGYSGAGTTVRTDSPSNMNTMMAGGRRLNKRDLDLYLDWATAGRADRMASSSLVLPDSVEEID